MQKNRTMAAVVAAAAAGTMLAMTGSFAPRPSAAAAPGAGKPAPAFSAATVDGKKVSLASFKGKSAVLLNFYSNG